ncbi:PAS domain S-box protein [Halobacteria archaeon AArc-curdl1]|uniref:histidine kinase n=1 Tax=Natronosalvus hydrolyticus TaxID=2979988 RepID=A0AAP2ZB94_9EURY|nr:PAS domain S-box protein [Halobacteria archaeon AArc-curdl1]
MTLSTAFGFASSLDTAVASDAALLLSLIGFGILGLASEGSRDSAFERLQEAIGRIESAVDVSSPSEDRVDGDLEALAERLESIEQSVARQTRPGAAYDDYLRMLVEAVDDVFFVIDSAGELKHWNQSMVEAMGYSNEELASMHAFDFFEDDVEKAEAALIAGLEEGSVRYEAESVRKDGESVPFEYVVSRVSGADGEPLLAGIARDISDRRENEQRLRERERQLSTLMHNIPGMVYRCQNEPEWPMEFVSDGCRELTGYDPEALVDGEITWAEDIVDGDNDELWETVQQKLERGEPFTVSFPIRTADGQRRWVEEQGRGIYAEDGTLEALEGVIIDITERVENERELERTSDLLQHAQRLSNVGGWELDLTDEPPYGGVLTAEMYRMYGLSRDESMNIERGLGYYVPEDRPRVREAVENAIEHGQPYELEAQIRTEEGELRWVRTIGQPIERNGEITHLRGSMQDITERKEREQTLERTREMLEQSQEIADLGGWVIDLEDGPPYEGSWTEKFAEILGLEGVDSMSFEESLEVFHPDDRPAVERTIERTIETGGEFELEARIRRPDGEQRWIRSIGEMVDADGDRPRVRGSIQDITDHKERELALQSLHEMTRGLLQIEGETDAAELIVETAEQVLDVTGIAMFLLDPNTNTLAPYATTAGFDDCCDGETAIGPGTRESILWETFLSGTQTVIDGSEMTARSPLFDAAVEAGLVVPVGSHGVFVVANRNPIGEGDRRLVETLVATTEAAFDRLESEATLRNRDAELEAQNERLSRQIQINDIIRRVDTSLIGTTTQEEIEQTVCDRLSESQHVSFAWIGSLDVAETEVVPRTWAGSGQSYLDSISLTVDDAPAGADPAVSTALTGESTVTENVADGLQREPWRKAALAHNFSSCLAVPLQIDEYSYGVLAVYTDEPNAFGDLERTVFTELGTGIADAINSVEARSALYAEAHIELRLRLEDEVEFLSRLARTAGCSVTYEGLGAYDTDETQLFVRTSGAEADEVRDALEALVTVTGYREITAEATECVFEITVSGSVLPAKLVRHGASPQSVIADGTQIRVVVDVPTTTDVREFIEMLGDAYDSVNLEGREHVDRSMHTRQQLVTDLFDELTDRQLEVLRTAYFAGFFDWPRESTGEDVAAMLEVSQPTINRHLRLGQQRLLEQLFERSLGEEPSSTSE